MGKKNWMFLSNYGTQKSPRVLIVQSPRAINLFQLIKLLKPWNYFCFCILSVDWRSSKTERQFSAQLKMAAPGSHANKNSTQINKRRMTKQHSSSMYVGLLSTSALPFFFFSLLCLSEQVLKVTCFLVSGTKCPPEREYNLNATW